VVSMTDPYGRILGLFLVNFINLSLAQVLTVMVMSNQLSWEIT
jgi:hypothetical protein